MSRSHYTFEQRLALVMHYLTTDEGYRLTSVRFNVPRTHVRIWVAANVAYGEEGLKPRLRTYQLILTLELPPLKRTQLIYSQQRTSVLTRRLHFQSFMGMPVIIFFHPFRQFAHYGHGIRQIIYIHVVPLERFHERLRHSVALRAAYRRRAHDEPQ